MSSGSAPLPLRLPGLSGHSFPHLLSGRLDWMAPKPAPPACKGSHLFGEATHSHSGLNISHSVSLIPATPQGEQAINARAVASWEGSQEHLLTVSLPPVARGWRGKDGRPRAGAGGLRRGAIGP